MTRGRLFGTMATTCMRGKLWGPPRVSVSNSDARGFMTTKPKPDTPLAPTRFIHPGADITDGATGKPYGQAGVKSAGQLRYERGHDGTSAPWDQLPPKTQARWQFDATVTPKTQTIKAP